MKVLVADDDALIRRLLTALLEKLGHEVTVAEDGNTALKALESTPPDVAILDWMMPGLSGLEVCKGLRAQPRKTRTYILLLSAKAERNEIIAGLDAGADDYLVKPFDPMALLARFRVAQRTLAYQQELQRHIVDMEGLLQRHNLLGEIFGKQGQGRGAGRGGERTVPEPPRSVAGRANTVAGKAITTPATLSPNYLNNLLTRALNEIGLSGAKAETLEGGSWNGASMFTAWAPLILPKEGIWVDLLLEVDDTSAVAKFEAMLGRIPVSERELLDFLAETFNLISTALRNYIAASGTTVLLPVISRSIRTASMNMRIPASAQVSNHQLTLPTLQLVVSAVRQLSPVVRKSLGQLREFDLLAENLPSPSTKEVFLLNQGVLLNDRYIEKLVSLARAEARDFQVPVIRPSPLAEFFCLGRVSG